MPLSRPVGIIANPASGKDIRRLVAHGSTFDNNEKINIVRRILIALGTIGVKSVWYMPDTYGIVSRGQAQAKANIELHELPMPLLGNPGDSLEAAQRLRDLEVACIITLGGDGTNRVVTKGCGDVPLVPISTGTNNVFPTMVEGTLAGLAAAGVALGVSESAIERRPMLELDIDGKRADIALIDAVATSQPWIGARAFWRADHVREIVLSHIPANAIGICSIGPMLAEEGVDVNAGVYASVAVPGRGFLLPIAPGLFTRLSVAAFRALEFGDVVTLQPGAGTLALDGEREIELCGEEIVTVTRSPNGPHVVNIDRAIACAIAAGLFKSDEVKRPDSG